jgi:hypothetical protein
MTAVRIDIDDVISNLLTRPQRKEVKAMTSCGFSRVEAVRKLLQLGVLVRQHTDLETDLCHGTSYALKRQREAAE